MGNAIFERATKAIEGVAALNAVGRVKTVTPEGVLASGLPLKTRLGDRVEICHNHGRIQSDVVRLVANEALLLPEGDTEGVSVGDPVVMKNPRKFAPDPSWIGRVIDPDGMPLDGRPLLPGTRHQPLRGSPPLAYERRPMGERLPTGYVLFDTLLPLVRGQRIGLFAGSGVGKSTLLAGLARGVGADVIVIALVGERGREVRDFVENTLGEEGMARSVVIAATSDRAPQTRRRCAWAATTVAEYFRDQGKQVLLLVDSLTRFAEAHREIALAAGEGNHLRGFPASTASALASLCERAGPGQHGQGDITAVYSVLVAGSDMEEPVADMLRGVLDGHIVMDREIAERGRYPAVDVLRSVSRSLPAAATEVENGLISEVRSLLSAYQRVELMVQSGLYTEGNDVRTDRAIALLPDIETVISRPCPDGIEASFVQLRLALDQPA